MAMPVSPSSLVLPVFAVFVALLSVSSAAASDSDRKVYIVYMGGLPGGDFSAEATHSGMLQDVLGSAASDSLVYSYRRSLNGFAAKLSPEEAKQLSEKDGVVSVFPSKTYELHTSRSWDFMGFTSTVKRSVTESDIIVGMIDTGIWPESESFSDKGFGPPPSKWKGICQAPSNFTCNNKVIGGRFYNTGGMRPGEFASPRDSEGHGSHTSSTAAGLAVAGASLEGLGEGTARGAVPSARIAVYKVCWSFGCEGADILKAFDDAIADGVDIISISIGSPFASEYFEDSLAIGAFHAMKNGILTSMSAGNSGPGAQTVSNFAPWALTVAASTIDRHFVTKVVLGGNKTYRGASINTFSLNDSHYPFVYGGNVPNTSAGYDGSISRFCGTYSLDEKQVEGKIVFCDQLSTGEGPLFAKATGTIMSDYRYTDYAFSYPLPAAFFGHDEGDKVFEYLNTTSEPTAFISKTSQIKDGGAPVVVSFSSRGPNPITANILKPDLSAPGVNILAAWSPVASMSVYADDKRSVNYNIISGTSMACPHASGAAAYLKSFYPSWSPAAIKSALMTTAYPMRPETNTDHEFAYGAGHINPVKALDPGLVYDAGEADYIAMLCSEGYNNKTVQLVTGDNSTICPSQNVSVWDLNYPSFTVAALPGKVFSTAFHRTVTNVGSGASTYKAQISAPEVLKITVDPDALEFKSSGEKQSFVLNVSGQWNGNMSSAFLIWKDGAHFVRSPIVVYSTA